MTTPLNGIRIVDFSKFLPGPYCTWMLADLGAEVIRIENPREVAKQKKVFGWDKLTDDENAQLRAKDILTRGKQSVLLNPGTASAKEAIFKLVKQADVLVEDYRPGVMESMGYSYEVLKTINPKLIYCSVTLCGQTGPYANKPGHDPIALATAGALSRMGGNATAPDFPGVPVADLLSGSNAVIGVLAALLARQTTGKGQQVDIAMSDASLALIINVLSRAPDLSSLPAKGMHRADSGIWRTADDKWLVTTDMEPRYWKQFCEATGLQALADEQMNKARWPDMKAEIASVMATRTQAQWCRIFEQAGTQFSPVLTIPEALENEHNLAREMIINQSAPDGTPVIHVGAPVKLSDTPAKPGFPGRTAGSDTQQILMSLGYSKSDTDQIIKEQL
ncbi:CaiB/BaiF CoA-transferase family protein [Alteromonas sp. 1_MG-2023]|uniref:CaiB/BaiF CoA transferase family protein n=1 Tax=Alteromonas sp. 1_MG-2023 TaxID=3062669 RepID=UPI0026E1E0F7|nr:CaiB/BaiF CoA-transferase family protein [Alteromonas sp. 1_MG-2023]MDO6474530.1 CaiB/BaiF CoA-transferase family protein [Alteromonas sp. 1_MG-2023]